MPRNTKSTSVIKKHLSKSEIEARKIAEEAYKSNLPLTEFSQTLDNPIAHGEFLRVMKICDAAGRNDDMYSAMINRYCMLYYECLEFERLKSSYTKTIEDLSYDKEKIVRDYNPDCDDTISLSQYYKMKQNFSKTIVSLDSAIMSKRRMLLDIEKEGLMTPAGSLRAAPKATEPAKNPLLEVLMDDD